MEDAFKADGKINKDEAKQLRDALDVASADIWAEKHDTDGNQKPVVRLGKSVFARSSTTGQIESGITGAQARALAHDFRTMVQLKRQLSGELSDADRKAKQAQYDTLLNKYFEIRS